nr:unnamed protein product [Digitaria exilis]
MEQRSAAASAPDRRGREFGEEEGKSYEPRGVVASAALGSRPPRCVAEPGLAVAVAVAVALPEAAAAVIGRA